MARSVSRTCASASRILSLRLLSNRASDASSIPSSARRFTATHPLQPHGPPATPSPPCPLPSAASAAPVPSSSQLRPTFRTSGSPPTASPATCFAPVVSAVPSCAGFPLNPPLPHAPRGFSSSAAGIGGNRGGYGAGGAAESPPSGAGAGEAPPGGGIFHNIRVEVVEGGQVGLITLARPKALNALSQAVMGEVVSALKWMDKQETVGATVITGEGRAFAAGADIAEMAPLSFSAAFKGDLLGEWGEVRRIHKATIAAVNGYALGGGCELAMMCDVILAGEKAVFGQPEVKLGVIPGMGGTQRLIRAVGKSRAMEMILTGEYFMGAEEAVRAGLASRLIPGTPEDLLKAAIETASKIASLSQPAIAMAKQSVNAAYDGSLAEGLALERANFLSTFALGDQKEGMGAFLEKREARFKHK